MGAAHIAIVDANAARQLRSGRKRVETRFYRRRRLPLGRVFAGDSIHFKVSGGDIIGTTRVLRVQEYADLTPSDLRDLRLRHNRSILAPPQYWQQRRRCRYGILLWIGMLGPAKLHKRPARQYGTAWILLGRADG